MVILWLSQIHICISQNMPLPKLKGKKKTQTLSLSLSYTHIFICLCVDKYENMDNYSLFPFWHKSLEQKMSSIMFKGFSVQLSGPAGQAHQGGISIECCSLNNKIRTQYLVFFMDICCKCFSSTSDLAVRNSTLQEANARNTLAFLNTLYTERTHRLLILLHH